VGETNSEKKQNARRPLASNNSLFSQMVLASCGFPVDLRASRHTTDASNDIEKFKGVAGVK
jgi:hypothetical protein